MMNVNDVPLLTPGSRKVPFGFSKPDDPVLIDQIRLAKDMEGN